MTKSVLAIVGGGRWGQVILSIVANMETFFDRIIIISKANAVEVSEKVAQLNLTSRTSIEIMSSVEQLLLKERVTAAVVVNKAAQHFETARLLIKHGVHVLIEKPIVLTRREMQTLLSEANHHHAFLVPGLSYRFCSYLHNFSEIIHKKGLPKTFLLEWSDAANEIRYGQVKHHDDAMTIVQDVMPHIWTILAIVFQQPNIQVQGGWQESHAASLQVAINNVPGKVLLKRHDEKRLRSLSLNYENDNLTLDFTTEPGIILKDNKRHSADSDWQQRPSPLTSQLAYFFSVIANGKALIEDQQYALDSVACSEAAMLTVPHLSELSHA